MLPTVQHCIMGLEAWVACLWENRSRLWSRVHNVIRLSRRTRRGNQRCASVWSLCYSKKRNRAFRNVCGAVMEEIELMWYMPRTHSEHTLEGINCDYVKRRHSFKTTNTDQWSAVCRMIFISAVELFARVSTTTKPYATMRLFVIPLFKHR
jgi:hypothetical protein